NEQGAAPSDSTANGNNAQNAGVSVVGSMIGNGLRFVGTPPVTIPASDSLKWIDGQPLTWSIWFKPVINQANAGIFSRRDGQNSFVVGIDNGLPYVDVNGTPIKAANATPLPVNAWHHLAVVSDGAKITVYLDGNVYATGAAVLSAMNSPMLIGGDSQPGTTAFKGEVDELEISKVARSEGFIKLEAIGQGSDGSLKLITFGADEQQTNWLSSFNSGTAGILIHSLTPDGWAVIAILMVMAIISWCVMISKASYLGKITKGNNHFLGEWRHVVSDLTILDDKDSDIKSMGGRVDAKKQRLIRNASVYRIYHIGAEEIRHRFSGRTNGNEPKVLSAQSIQAIRASLDAGMVKESHKLNNMMVLLTIAISGGPFLGLLGTVVGVMITFASIAAAGEVNVNAIAPGIAAALLATVAGLAVAIPSLFGYNYLTIRIKNATSDMHVFIDEFVTKMAEFYRPRPEAQMPRGIPPPREFSVIREED
ncbi:MAG TPA: MotA/TolQ/ExbB proton channel family protein, partial [Chthoniobacteraceae bacterium]|nr:MotA/TolQ/ExbB proton channel family protein [Chthoniobacteraceae bacterium]